MSSSTPEVGTVQRQATMTTRLQQQLNALRGLEQLLQQEQEALLRRDSEALARIAAEKQTQLDNIEVLSTHGDVAQTSDDDGIAPLREGVEAALLRCQKQNQVNGVMLERDRQQTRHLLALLLGKQPGQGQTELYDARGGTHSSYAHGQPVKA